MQTVQVATGALVLDLRGRMGAVLVHLGQSYPAVRWARSSAITTSTQPDTFADLLQRYRRALGLTQEQLAERAHLSERGISNLERGVRRFPQRGTVILLADALGLQAAERRAFEAASRSSTPSPGRDPVEGAAAASRTTILPLVGRTQELALLKRHVNAEGPPVLLFTGEPGIGKSRLLQETAVLAIEQGWRVLHGGCRRRGGQEPFAPVLEALEGSLHALSQPRLRATLQDCAWLVRLLPELAAGPIEPLPAWKVSPDQERRLLFKAVARCLRNMAGPAGTLLILDDLQWAGGDALDLLATLVRPEAPLRVVGAYRDTEVSARDPLAMFLADLAQAGLATQRAVEPLTESEVGALLEGLSAERMAADPALRDQLIQRAGGVPFFVVSCAQSLGGDGAARDLVDAIPWTLTQGLGQRIAVLPRNACELLAIAAVIGRSIPRTVLLAVATQPEDEVLAALDAACQARLLVEHEQGYAFVHDVIREFVEAGLGKARRVALHRRVLAALEAQAENGLEQRVDLLAYHSRHADQAGKAAVYAQQAGDHAMRMAAYREAMAHYEAALELLAEDDLPARAAVRFKLGEAAYPLGDTAVYLRHWQEAHRLYEQIGERHKAAGLARRLGRVAWERGETSAALAYTRAAVAGLTDSPPSHELAMAYSALSQLLMLTNQPRESIDWGEKALALADTLGDDAVRVHALNNVGSSLFYLGELRRGIAYLERSLALALQGGLVHDIMRACNNLGGPLGSLGANTRATEVLREGLDWVERAGWESHRSKLLANLADAEMELGHWTEALSLIRDLRADETAFPRARLLAAPVHGELLLRSGGSLRDARSMLEEVQTIAEREDDVHTLRDTLSTLARVYLDLEDTDRAVQVTDRWVELFRASGPLVGWELALEYGVEVYLHAGRVESARELVEGLSVLGRRADNVLSQARFANAQGLLAGHECRYREAAAHFERAAALWLTMSCPYQEAWARKRRAESLLHASDAASRATAEQELDAARTIFQRLGPYGTSVTIDAV